MRRFSGHSNRGRLPSVVSEGGTVNRRCHQTPSNHRRLPTIVCPFCDQIIKSNETVVRCRNCGECFERELEYLEEEPGENFF